ncbi:MAG: c-type cytochrome biogenesis protein CcsB [Pseudonocardiaceae bacterium]|nr:c-type cytochrome biogenesis protein CcsB [Pseudonocardiaceae bacterium]
MPVDPVLAFYGDAAFYTALVLYLVAMVLQTVEYAAQRSAEPVAAAVGGGDGVGGGVATLAPPAGERAARSRSERTGRVAVSLTVLAAAVHAASLVLRGLAAGRVPWGNMYEFTSAICLVAVVAWLVVLVRQREAAPALRRLGGFVLLPVVVLLFLAGTVLYAEAAPLIPALNSYWIAIHVFAVSVASGVLLVAGVSSALYLVRLRAEASGGEGGSPGSRFAARLPGSALLDRLAYRTTVVAFPIWTFGVITGAIWAEAAWGRYWGWDPKETVALVAWVVYACYLHARATAGWRGARAAWINLLGFAVMVFNLFFINIVVAGLHSYAGV